MKTIAIVQKNRCSFDRIEEFASPLLYCEHSKEQRTILKEKLNDYLWSVVEPYVTFIDVADDQDLLGIICNKVTECFPDRKLDEFFYHTEGSYSFPKKYIEFIHCQPLKDYQKSQIENINNLSCLFSLKHNVVENTCAIFANSYDLSLPNFTKLDSITKDDILRVIRRRFFFSALLIKENDMIKYYYQNPQYLITKVFGLTEKDNIEKMSFSHFKYNLTFYFQHDKTKYINKIATRINGTYRLHGDVLVLHELEENIFGNISIHEAKRLNVLSYGRLYDRQLKEDEVHTMPSVEVDENGNQTEKKVTPLWSRYIVVNKRMLKWENEKNKCINCGENIVRQLVCEKCYRVKYCSEKCRKEFDSYHWDECINPKSY